jgi:predicted RecB family nuclease
MIPMLSKTRFIAGCHCPLRLWYLCYDRELAAEVSPAQQAVFDTGHEVGRLATHLYPGGVLIEEDHLQHEKAVQTTLSVIEDKNVPAIYEAAFVYDDIRVRVDILDRCDDGTWNLIEVKSSTSVKETHLPDVAVQYYVLKSSGLTPERCGILHLNNQYVYDGNDLKIESLFSFSELTKQVSALEEKLPSMIAELKQMLSGTVPPDMLPSRMCNNPYGCEFWAHCTREKPEFWVMKLFGITQKRIDELAELDIEDICDIPGSFPLTKVQERIRDCVANNEDYIAPELVTELSDVEYPVHFLDFETVGPAIPRYADTRTYQALPFQWSDHIVYHDETIEHREYLCLEDKDPREEFSRTLLEALGNRGTIFVYTNYEKNVISELAEFFPEYRDRLVATLKRFKDLHALVRKHVYQPEFHGSFSLKSILPALVPSMRYEDLAIQDGRHASVEYLRMLDDSTPPEEREKIRQALLGYCGYDTLGMVKIREELLRRRA